MKSAYDSDGRPLLWLQRMYLRHAVGAPLRMAGEGRGLSVERTRQILWHYERKRRMELRLVDRPIHAWEARHLQDLLRSIADD